MVTPENYLFTTKHGCGRYALTQPDKIKDRFGIKGPIPVLSPNYNAAPTQDMPVVTHRDGANHLEIMRWGLQPAWARDQPNFAWKTFNARAESLQDKPMWTRPFRKLRCLVPVNGYYEWQKVDSKTKQPYFFHIHDNALFALAGLYDAWTDEQTGEVNKSFSIITTSPNKIQAPIHDRMPVILEQSQEELWLDESNEDTVELASVLKSYSGKDFEVHCVDMMVSNARNNGPELINPK